jgi:hypothetical protein
MLVMLVRVLPQTRTQMALRSLRKLALVLVMLVRVLPQTRTQMTL